MGFASVVGVLLLVLVVFAVGLHLSALARVVLDAVATVLRMLQEPFNILLTAVEDAIAGLTERLRTVFPAELPWTRRAVIVAVAVFCAVVAVVLFWCDYGLVQLTLEAMGFTTGQGAGASPDRLMALSLALSAAFWAIVLLDALGLTHLDWFDGEQSPTSAEASGTSIAEIQAEPGFRQRLWWWVSRALTRDKLWRWATGVVSVLGLLLAVAIGGALGLRRAQSVSSPALSDAAELSLSDLSFGSGVDTGAFGTGASFAAVDTTVPDPAVPTPAVAGARTDKFVGVGLPVLLTVTSSFAAVGLFHAVSYASAACLLALWFVLTVTRLVISAVVAVLNIVYGLAESLVRILASAFIGIWNWAVEFSPRRLGFSAIRRRAGRDQWVLWAFIGIWNWAVALSPQRLGFRPVVSPWPPPDPVVTNGAATAPAPAPPTPDPVTAGDPPAAPGPVGPEPSEPPTETFGTASFNPLGL